jgi:outer membrane protein OmpA-like peptidoglycan-associated protein
MKISQSIRFFAFYHILFALTFLSIPKSSFPAEFQEIICGSVFKGEKKECKINLSEGNVNLYINQNDEKPFSFSPNQVSESANLTSPGIVSIYFSPSSTGIYLCSITVVDSSSTIKKVIILKGEGLDESFILPNPSSFDLKETKIGETAQVNFSIYNKSYFSEAFILSGFSCDVTRVLPQSYVDCNFNFTSPQDAVRVQSFFILPQNKIRISDKDISVQIRISGIWAEPVAVFETEKDFGAILAGRKKRETIYIENQGNYPLIISRVIIIGNEDEHFSVDLSETTYILPQKKLYIPVEFYPKKEGEFSSQISFISNAGILTAYLKGKAISNPYPTIYTREKMVDFGVIFPSEVSYNKIKITNVGAENLIIKDINLRSSEFFLEGVSSNLILEPLSSLEIKIGFAPLKEGNFSSQLIISSSDPFNSEFQITLTGRSSSPKIFIPDEVNFGYVRLNNASKKYIIIQNQGLFPVILTKVIGDNSETFSYTMNFNLPKNINYGESLSIYAEFIPREPNYYEIPISFHFIVPKKSDMSEFEEKILTTFLKGFGGMPYIKIKAEEIDMGKIFEDEEKKIVFPIENTGKVPLSVSLVLVSDKFFVSPQRFEVDPESAKTVEIIFRPQGKSGYFESYMRIISDDPLAPEKIVILKALSKSPEEKFKGGGCSSKGKETTNSQSFILLTLSAVLLVFLSKKTRILSIALFISSLLLPEKSYSLNFSYLRYSYDDFSFLQTSYFVPKEVWRIYAKSYFISSPLFKSITKDEEEVKTEKLIYYALPTIFGVVYSPTNLWNISIYTPISLISKNRQIFFSQGDIIISNKISIGKLGESDISGEVSFGIPSGDEDLFFKSNPFSFSLIFVSSYKNFSANSGVVYGGKEIPMNFLISFGAQKEIIQFISGYIEIYGFIPISYSFNPGGEIIGGTKLNLGEFATGIGLGKGFGKTAGIPSIRLGIFSRYDFVPGQRENVKYFSLNGEIYDEFGNGISNCKILLDRIFTKTEAKDGKFELLIPYGTYKMTVLCEGFLKEEIYISEKDRYVRLQMRKSLPQVIVFSTDKNAIPQEKNIKISFGEKSFSFTTYYIVAKGNKSYLVQDESSTMQIELKEGQVKWVRLPYEKTEEKPKAEIKSEMEINNQKEEEKNKEEEKAVEEKEKQEKKGFLLKAKPLFQEEEIDTTKQTKIETKTKSQEKSTKEQRKIQSQEKPTENQETINNEKEEEGERNKDKDKDLEKIVRAIEQKSFEIYFGKESATLIYVIDNFGTNSYTIPKYGIVKLQEISNFIKSNIEKIKEIIIEGHTDDVGTYEWNMELSYKRAEEIRKQLFGRGIIFPMKVVGYGVLFPVEKTENPERKGKNRRVEIKIVLKE